MKDLVGIEPPKSFRNAGDSVPYGALEESDKLKFVNPSIFTFWYQNVIIAI